MRSLLSTEGAHHWSTLRVGVSKLTKIIALSGFGPSEVLTPSIPEPTYPAVSSLHAQLLQSIEAFKTGEGVPTGCEIL